MISKFLNIGIDDTVDVYQQKETRFLNLFSWIIIVSVVVYLLKLLFTHDLEIVGTEIGFFSFAFIVLFLNSRKFYNFAIVIFVLGLNLAMMLVNLTFVNEAGNYLYYFPILICTALLHNPLKPMMRTVTLFSLAVASIILTFYLEDKVNFRYLTNVEQTHQLLVYNVYNASLLTIVLIGMIIRLINQQHVEFTSFAEKINRDRITIQNSLQEKEVLLAEVQHRVKNNLSVILGLFNLQLDKAENEAVKDLLTEAKNRVMSIAMVHQKIYKKEDLSKINLSNYLSDLVQDIVKSHSLTNAVHVHEDLNNIDADVTTAVPVGLIVNEVITNSLKHGFKDSEKTGILKICLSSVFGKLIIKIQDNGNGFPPNYDRVTKNIGLTLINALTDQLDGSVTFRNEEGAVVELSFPYV